MTRGIVIEGATLTGEVVASFTLPHGGDPSEELARRGWAMIGICETFTPPDSTGAVIRVRVVAELEGGQRHRTRSLGRTGEVLPEGVAPVRVQRLAAYAVIPRDGELLLTQFSDRVRSAAGMWGLPGGGVDAGEDPVTGLRREVWEETGQHLGPVRLIDLLASHWIGQNPDGTWEDYQVVRLIFAAGIPDPAPLVVHDVGGTTEQAAWVSVAEVLAPGAPVVVWHRLHTWLSLAGDRATPTRR